MKYIDKYPTDANVSAMIAADTRVIRSINQPNNGAETKLTKLMIIIMVAKRAIAWPAFISIARPS